MDSHANPVEVPEDEETCAPSGPVEDRREKKPEAATYRDKLVDTEDDKLDDRDVEKAALATAKEYENEKCDANPKQEELLGDANQKRFLAYVQYEADVGQDSQSNENVLANKERILGYVLDDEERPCVG